MEGLDCCCCWWWWWEDCAVSHGWTSDQTYLYTHINMRISTTENRPLTSPATGEPLAAIICPHFTLRKLIDAYVEETRREWVGSGGGQR